VTRRTRTNSALGTADADASHAQSNIGTRIFGGRMGAVNNGTASTFQIVCELAQNFDAVRLVIANTQYQISDNTVSMKVSTPTTTADLNNSGGTWTTVTKAALSRMATAIAPASANRISYTVTDWISLASVARSDSGTQPMFAARVFMSGNAALPCYGNGTDDFTNWATRTDGRLWCARSMSGDGVTTPSSFTSTTNQSQSPIVGVQYLSRGKVISVGAVGDSITEGRGTYLNDGFILPAVAELSSMTGTAVEYSNFGWSTQSMSQYGERAIDILESEVRPDILVIPAGSPNDQPVTLTAAGIAAFQGMRGRILATCAQRNVVPVMWTWLPVNTAVNPWGSSDSLRVADNAAVLAQPKLLVADTSTAISGTVSGGQVQIAVADTTDGIHPNDTGNAVLKAVIKPVLAKAVATAGGGRKGLIATPSDVPVRVITTTNANITGSGVWICAAATAANWSLAPKFPSPRKTDSQLIFVKVRDSAAPLTITGSAGDNFLVGGVAQSTYTIQPGESVILIPDGTNWLPMAGAMNPATNFRVVVSAASTLTLDRTGTVFVFTGTTTTWTLPALANNTGLAYRIKNRGSGAITLQRAGSDNIYDTSSVTSISIAAGASREIINDGSFWLAI
jgi:lysophospholipase L1-like esterase